MRLRQVLGGFTGTGAERAMARVRRTAAGCEHRRVRLPGDRSTGPVTVTLERVTLPRVGRR